MDLELKASKKKRFIAVFEAVRSENPDLQQTLRRTRGTQNYFSASRFGVV